MSSDYILSEKVTVRDLFAGRLERRGIREHVSTETDEWSRCLTDGRNYLWVDMSKDGRVGRLSTHAANSPRKILAAIAEIFDTKIFGEDDPQYWGFDTHEVWDAAMKAMAERDRNEFYVDVCAYVRGEPNRIRPGTIGELKAKIAKKRVEEDPALLRPESKERLLAEIETIYDRDHAVVITLSPEDLALAKMLATHDDDLPQA